MHKIILNLMMICLAATMCHAAEYEETISSNTGILLEDGSTVQFTNSDIGFLGLEEKEEGYEKANLYANHLIGAINKKGDEECDSLGDEAYSSREAQIDEGHAYCVRIMDRYGTTGRKTIYVELNVKKLADDWSSVKIEWEIPEEEIPEEETESEEESYGIGDIIFVIFNLIIFAAIVFMAVKINGMKGGTR